MEIKKGLWKAFTKYFTKAQSINILMFLFVKQWRPLFLPIGKILISPSQHDQFFLIKKVGQEGYGYKTTIFCKSIRHTKGRMSGEVSNL